MSARSEQDSIRLSRRERHQVRTEKVNRRGARVLIFGSDHPHCGETGTVDRNDEVRPRDGGAPMVRVDLDPGAGAPHCYAEASDLMPVSSSYARGR